MPRGPRLDTAGALHHVMVRGLDRQPIFRTVEDREDFLARLASAWKNTGLLVLAWAVLPNHVHLLVRTGHRPLATAMRRVLTGYAGAFNRRHHRVGHLFQNRYKSILVEEEPYLAELVRYIHLNPLRIGLVKDLDELDRYPWTGHATLMGHGPYTWQAMSEVLGLYGARVSAARRAYRMFVSDGIAQGRRPDLQGGGLRRSAGGWERVASVRRGREAWAADERILGSSDFVEEMRQTAAAQGESTPAAEALAALPRLIECVAKAAGITVAECCGGGRRKAVVAARAAVSTVAVHELGLPLVTVARALGVSLQTVLAGATQRIKASLPPGATRKLPLGILRKPK